VKRNIELGFTPVSGVAVYVKDNHLAYCQALIKKSLLNNKRG